ncbi:serine/threonine protein kinase [Paenibacillus swuensis]|uniref:Serine/threonine protein kinase n=1 Tax=Paenibacillus swuensis TaxID=1178515 RepID=A0A172TMQ2_9BACL|nr:anti-sigma B factor RsbW [Paenibacillus swuensis]ANE48107.1 serine/threonine protein kinase [Paenibacillus swuensis]
MNASDKYVSLRLPADAEYVDIVRLTLYGIAVKMGFTYEQVEDMKVAVSEACNNAVLHAYEGIAAGYMEIRFERGIDSLTITVKDEGKSFDVGGRDTENASMHNKQLDEVQAGGLGLYLMQALMDDVRVESETGTEVVLTKLLSRSQEKEMA